MNFVSKKYSNLLYSHVGLGLRGFKMADTNRKYIVSQERYEVSPKF